MTIKKFIVIAIDGGAASGKSSTSKKLAERLNLLYVDTGSHYRSIAHMLLSEEIYPEDHAKILNKLHDCKLNTQVYGRIAQMTINDEVPSDDDLRSSLVNRYVSHFAAVPELRECLLEYERSQRDLAIEYGFSGLVMEGRDIGSIVLPNADFRFFLEADPEMRKNRRTLQGQDDSIQARDQIDLARKNAPMICPIGATRVDTSSLTLEEVVDAILSIITKNKNSII